MPLIRPLSQRLLRYPSGNVLPVRWRLVFQAIVHHALLDLRTADVILPLSRQAVSPAIIRNVNGSLFRKGCAYLVATAKLAGTPESFVESVTFGFLWPDTCDNAIFGVSLVC